MSYAWNYAEILAEVEKVTPANQPALIHGDRVIYWQDFIRRTNNLARNLLEAGVQPGDKIAFYLRNCPEYPEGVAAAFKANLVHVNVNYRYIDHELIYLLDNSDAAVVVYQAEFQPLVDKIRGELPKVKLWVSADNGEPSVYEELAEKGDGTPPDARHSPDDLIFVYTGGTTGLPKGVMWRHDDLFRLQNTAVENTGLSDLPFPDMEAFIRMIVSNPRPVSMPLPPIMHGTGLTVAISTMMYGGTCITLPSRRFDPEMALDYIDRYHVKKITIVGDAFARPLLEALDANPGRWDFSSLAVITSSGVMWTKEVKAGLLRHNENLRLLDIFGSSEAAGMGASEMTRDREVDVAKFTIGPNCKVFTEAHHEVAPGSGEAGMVAVTGHLPLGYYKDKEKTEKTFKVINGVRYAIPGDWVRVETDGTLTLLGRGSNCINTAGEKVYPEEVEEALKLHEGVEDALVFGVKDAKWGQSITAVVQFARGHQINEQELREFARQHLAAYKIPKRILSKDNLERAPNGKADYGAIMAFAEKTVSAPSES